MTNTEAPTTIKITAEDVRVTDTIVTRHGANFGTVEIESIAIWGKTPAGCPVIQFEGFQNIRGGVCGPWSPTKRADDVVEIVAR